MPQSSSQPPDGTGKNSPERVIDLSRSNVGPQALDAGGEASVQAEPKVGPRMAEVYIAAAPEEDARARVLAETLKALGFDVAAGAPAEAEIAKIVEDAKCVIGLWTQADAPAGLAMLSALAHERKKLVNAEIVADASPAPVRSAPRVDLKPRDRTTFKTRLEELTAEITKFSPAKGEGTLAPDILIKARAGLANRPRTPAERGWRKAGLALASVAALFVVGFGAGRVINAVRAGEFHFTMPRITLPQISLPRLPERAEAPPSAAEAETTAAPALSSASLETEGWRTVAARIDETAAARIKEQAATGDAEAQTLACLGHMAGAPGFLPSPTAAREQCNAASAQQKPAALYLSWVLHRYAPHAGIGAGVAQQRLGEAARLGWLAAQIDYALTLPADANSQAEAGRMWLAAAERGDARGQFFYARWLRDSSAGPRDPAAAVPYLERAAQAGQADAQHMLATFYRDGTGVARDAERAKALYDQAARQNHAASMFNLADLLRDGPPAERARAVELYRALACMPDERQIQPRAIGRLRALQETWACR